MMSLLLLFEGWNGSIENFGDELAEVRRLGLVEFSATVLGWKSPRIWCRADETAGRIAIVELKEIHHNDFVDDGADLARHLGTLHLKAILDEAVEIVGDPLEDDDKDHVLLAHVLQLVQPHQHLARMQAVNAAQILGASALGARLRLLLRRAEGKPVDSGNAIDEKRVVAIEAFEPSASALEVRLGIAAGRGERRVRPADADRDIARGFPVFDMDRIDRHILHT